MAAETHLTKQRATATEPALRAAGWQHALAHAVANKRSVAGEAALFVGADPGNACTGGLLIAHRPWLHVSTASLVVSSKYASSVCAVRWRTAGLDILIVGLYLHPDEVRDKEHIKILHALVCALSLAAAPFIVAGDFNATPAQIMDLGLFQKVRAAPIYPADIETTCTPGCRIIDFFMVSDILRPAVTTTQPVSEAPWTPHVGLSLTIAARPMDIIMVA